jgi:hypothetical protein
VAISTPEQLVGRCKALVAGADAAEAWVGETRGDCKPLRDDADDLIERLRRARNAARRFGAAASRPVAAGFFGLSQAGKSYLISALARGENGSLETLMDGARLNFISHVNPPGGGKEATGIVTRFTRLPAQGPAGFPVALSLLSEADLIKIIGNTYFLDFDPEKRGEAIDQDRLRAHIALPKLAAGTRHRRAVRRRRGRRDGLFHQAFPASMGAFESASFGTRRPAMRRCWRRASGRRCSPPCGAGWRNSPPPTSACKAVCHVWGTPVSPMPSLPPWSSRTGRVATPRPTAS